MPAQVQGNTVVKVQHTKERSKADGVVTLKRIHLGVSTADCLPLLFFSPEKSAVAAVHAGWKGLLSGVIMNTISEFESLHVLPSGMTVSIGPHIHVCCYEIGNDVAEKFQAEGYDYALKYKDARIYLDMARVATFQLTSRGIPEEQIEILNVCTKETPSFASYRRDGLEAGRNISYIGIL